MTGELENQIRQKAKEPESARQLLDTVKKAVEEFPCLTCPSHDECGTYKWFTKWFSQPQPNQT